MAVEKSKVIARLKALFPKANLSQKRLDALADKLASKPADDADDAAIDLVINDFNSVLSIEEIAREDDRVRTLEQKANPNPPTQPVPSTPPSPPKGDDVPSWAQAILDSNKKLEGELEALKTGKIIETKKQTASELFAKSEVLKRIPEGIRQNWINRLPVSPETSQEEMDLAVKALEEEYSTLVQVNADNNQYSGPAGNGSAEIKADDAVVESIVKI